VTKRREKTPKELKCSKFVKNQYFSKSFQIVISFYEKTIYAKNNDYRTNSAPFGGFKSLRIYKKKLQKCPKIAITFTKINI